MSDNIRIDDAAAPDDFVVEQSKGAPRLGLALVLITVAQLMVVLDATIANIALPFIGKDLDISGINLTWIVTGYTLVFGGLLLLGGRLADLYGRRRIFMIGLVVFAVASMLGGLAQSETLLLGARGLQGLGAALASPAALALITTTFPAGPARNRAFAVYAAMSGAGAAVGLILGGWLTGSDFTIFGADVHGWRMTFLINVPIGIVTALLAPRFLPESETHPGQLDVPGAITGTGGLLAIVFGLTHAGNPSYGWGDPWTITSLVAGVILLALFVAVESRVEHPLLPFRIFANRTRAASFVAMALLPAAMFSMFFFLSLFIQNVMGYSPLKTGVAFLPFSAGIIISATIVSNLVNRIDARYIAGTGTLVAATALFGFSRLSVPDSESSVLQAVLSGQHLGADVSYWTHVFPFVVLMALGMGAVFVPLTLTAVHHVRSEDSGIGSGVLNTMQQVGGALGLAILSTVASHFTTSRIEETAPAIGRGLQGADPGVIQQLMDAFGVGSVQELVGQVSYLGAFTEGATAAFLVGVFLMLAGSAVVWAFLDVKHEELATDGPEGVHVG
ncbi:MFS transporter [Nocardioides agariphilus]|jgi:EmrB/QacA subfamily drug resistance transporter|uniref:MFS transporter n=1 Tax=Nocardioides agariphilus TaxID=433664 RepID=A0A930VR47_9ACTN|nr:MFS transporter [Nocardioides agariphilus]MBF4769162.1 MFS transporter [Nocardioides agariphilus]